MGLTLRKLFRSNSPEIGEVEYQLLKNRIKRIHEKDSELVCRLNSVVNDYTYRIDSKANNKLSILLTEKPYYFSRDYTPQFLGFQRATKMVTKFRMDPETWTPEMISREMKISLTEAQKLYSMLEKIDAK